MSVACLRSGATSTATAGARAGTFHRRVAARLSPERRRHATGMSATMTTTASATRSRGNGGARLFTSSSPSPSSSSSRRPNARAISSSSVAKSAAASEGAGAASSEGADEGETTAAAPTAVDEDETPKKGIKAWWVKASKIDKSTIAALGGAALLSYGFVSNIFYVSSLLLATYTSVKTCGASPLVSKAAMQSFCTTYFGLWMIQNFLRPARMALSVAISPWTDKLVEVFRGFVPGKKKPFAFGLTVFCVNVLGTFAYLFGGFFLISALTGVPLELDNLKGLLTAAKAARGGPT